MSVLNIKDKVRNNKLNLSNMDLTEIPVSELVPLQISHLDLSNNKITSTNNVFSLLPSLLKLDLSNNQIKKVAGDINLLENLVYLSLANNMIKDLPKGLSNLKKLKYLNLNNNPLKSELFKAIGPSQTNKQCKIAAANAIQYLKDSKSGFKKKDEKQNKKDKKSIKASLNVEQNSKSNDTPESKMMSGRFTSKGFGFFSMVIPYMLLFLLFSGLAMYALSSYYMNTYGHVRAELPIWASAISNLDPQLAVQTSVETSIKYMHQYFKYAQETLKSLWDSVPI